mmetsp:Transcript_30925/g.35319  ORF Transcript_30925/g.35319 Transcript_30925/m.35319 type:complete len:83 (+) Transcript_30925:406-654(+)
MRLYLAKSYPDFASEHFRLVMMYINHHSSLSILTVSFLLDHWSRKNSSSECCFLQSILAILEHQDDEQFDVNSAALFKRIAE